MAWDRSAPTDPKYRTPEYQRMSAQLKAAYKARGWVECVQPECIEDSRHIVWPTPVHCLHDDTGTIILGLGHPTCNLRHAAVKASARSRTPTRWKL